MGPSSIAVVAAAFLSVAAAQSKVSALPEISAAPASACGGCFLVADVANVVFGDVITVTQTNIIVTGRNGTITQSVTRTDSTAIPQTMGHVTFGSGGPVTGAAATGAAATAIPTTFTGSTIVINGATLTYPTAYEVFSAYTVTRTTQGADGKCSVTTAPAVVLPSAIQYAITGAADADQLRGFEASFISSVGFPSCSAQGHIASATVQPVAITTADITTSSSLRRPTLSAPSTTIMVNNATNPVPMPTVQVGAGTQAQPALSLWGSFAGLFGLVLFWL